MSLTTLGLSEPLQEYLLRVSVRESEWLRALREETAQLPAAGMQISPEMGQMLKLLVELCGARRALEVGVFTGYSSLCIASALPPDGRLVACDVSEEYTAVAQRYWDQAGVADRVDLRVQPAVRTLDELLSEGQAGHYDFAFVDADKENYLNYYERVLELLRPGGVVVFDNVLWGGAVADPDNQKSSTVAIRALNDVVGSDARVSASLIPIGDGAFVARKRG